MLSWLRKTAGPDRSVLLAAVPVRNELITETRSDRGALRLKAPLRQTLLGKMFGASARDKSFELDELGAWVWSRIDGRRDVERIIKEFSQAQRVNLREAEVAVLAFLRMLLQRGIVALQRG